jgi:hypothetical protein
MKYKYQLHTHTAPTSKCAKTTPRELAKALYYGGYAGCVLTNHFYHGNTGVSRELAWEDFVAAYERDYLECKKEGEKYGLDILFGLEEGVEGYDEILCYGLTPKMLYEHPELRECSAATWYFVMRELGVVVINAHPFRSGRRHLPLELIDGIEVYNHGNSSEENAPAEALSRVVPELILTSGGDTHAPGNVPFGGIETDTRITDERELARILKEGKYQLLKP